MEELLKSLIFIQQNLNAPKDKFNSFGKYNYRSLEGILAALKPLLNDEGCGIRFQDEVVEHSGRTFLKTTLIFFNDKGQSITTTAEAAHASEKSGMDAAQITGAASSYARKYAMNAMFAIDDSLDADTEEYHNQTHQPEPKPTRKASARRSTSAPTDRYANIRLAINSVNDIDGLYELYFQHQQEVTGNEDIKKLFTLRKQQLLTTHKAA